VGVVVVAGTDLLSVSGSLTVAIATRTSAQTPI